MNIEQQRAAFEAWHTREMWDGGYFSGHNKSAPDTYRKQQDGFYCDTKTQIAWRGWQAAIELDWQVRGEPYAWQPPGRCVTCNGEGIVGNALNAQPCPDCLTPQPADPAVKDSLTAAEPVKEVSDAEIDAAWRKITGRPCLSGSVAHTFARALLKRVQPASGEPIGYVHPNVAVYGMRGREFETIWRPGYFAEGMGVPVYFHPKPASGEEAKCKHDWGAEGDGAGNQIGPTACCKCGIAMQERQP